MQSDNVMPYSASG